MIDEAEFDQIANQIDQTAKTVSIKCAVEILLRMVLELKSRVQKLERRPSMTTTVIVDAHCSAEKEVVFGKKSMGALLADNAIKDTAVDDLSVLQDGESAEKYVYDNQVAVIFQREKP